MCPIEVVGIDRDEESRSITVEHLPPAELAKELYEAGWKYAQLKRGGQLVGAVEISVPKQARVYWGEPE